MCAGTDGGTTPSCIAWRVKKTRWLCLQHPAVTEIFCLAVGRPAPSLDEVLRIVQMKPLKEKQHNLFLVRILVRIDLRASEEL